MNDYKFDIINQTRLETTGNEPKFFLGDTKEEAEKIYNSYKKKLNSISTAYSMYSGIDASDLFAVALMALGKARMDWDEKRSSDFDMFATYIIKDGLNEYIRKNKSQVIVPSYIKKAQNNLKKIKSVCSKYTLDYMDCIACNLIPDNIESNDKSLLIDQIIKLKNASDRAKVDLSKFIERLEIIPINTESIYPDKIATDDREKEIIEAKLVVEQLKKYMTDIELEICNKLMEDKTYETISKEMNKSTAWIAEKMKNLRRKMIDRIKI